MFEPDTTMALFALTLKESGEQHLRAHHPQLPLTDLVSPAGVEPGRPVRLMDVDAATLASGIADPENEVVRVWSRGDEARGFDAAFFRERLTVALSLRRTLGLVDGRSAYRLLNGEGDGLGGLTVDVYGAFAVVTAASRGLLTFARALAEQVRVVLTDAGSAVRGVVIKTRLKGQPTADRGKDEIVGDRPADKLIVEELGVPYELHLLGGLNVGLFTDMREHRRGLARFVRGLRVLNTFAYTGALSVAAARAGAAEITSVDLAAGPLAWARENLRLSGFQPDAPAPGEPRFRFEASDVTRFLEAEHKRGTTWDVVILDPPTVSGARASSWAQKRDYPELIALAASVLPAAGGHLWVSSNTHKGASVLRHIELGLQQAGRQAAVLELGGLPPDYPTPVAWPAARYLEVCQLLVR